jgi:hypothetical protein
MNVNRDDIGTKDHKVIQHIKKHPSRTHETNSYLTQTQA